MTLRITISIVPHGDEKRAYPIHVLEAHNLGPSFAAGDMHAYSWSVDDHLSSSEIYHRRENGAIRLAKMLLTKADERRCRLIQKRKRDAKAASDNG